MTYLLAGCGVMASAPRDPASEAKAYLENKYNAVFDVKEFSRKLAGGPFPKEEYSGTACCLDEPAFIFDVWATKDLSAFYDNYYAVEVMKELDVWLE